VFWFDDPRCTTATTLVSGITRIIVAIVKYISTLTAAAEESFGNHDNSEKSLRMLVMYLDDEK
jgi:hypothetical protein